MCDCCPKECPQKFPSQKRSIRLSPEFLNNGGSKIYLQLPFCVNECKSNCNLDFTDFHFVAICLKDHCRTTYTDLNDPECNGGELSEDLERLFSLTQLPGTRVTLSRVGICLQNNDGQNNAATALWNALETKFHVVDGDWKSALELCIEYWVECEDCCTDEENATVVVPPVT